MSIQKIIQESINGNPLEMKEALQEELRARVAEAIAAKMEEVDLDESFEEGDKVHFEDEYGQKLHGHITKPFSGKKNGAKHAEVKLAGGMGTKMHVPHGQLKKMDESFDLSDLTLEEIEDFMESAEFDQLDEISKKTLGSYAAKARANRGSGKDREKGISMAVRKSTPSAENPYDRGPRVRATE